MTVRATLPQEDTVGDKLRNKVSLDMRSVEHLLLAVVVRVDKLLWTGAMFQSGACGEAKNLMKLSTTICGEQALSLSLGSERCNGECIGSGSACQSCDPALTVT